MLTTPTMLLDEKTTPNDVTELDVARLAIEIRQLYREDIAQLLDIVNRDSNSRPLRYLEESMVPHGGE
jgi:hypothetical protein